MNGDPTREDISALEQMPHSFCVRKQDTGIAILVLIMTIDTLPPIVGVICTTPITEHNEKRDVTHHSFS